MLDAGCVCVCLLRKSLLRWLKNRVNRSKETLGPRARCSQGGVSLIEIWRGEGSRGSGYLRCVSVHVGDVWLWRREWLMFGVQRGRQIADMGGGVKGPKGSG